MALRCMVRLGRSSCQAEGSPVAAAVIAYNPTAAALVITGGRLHVRQLSGERAVSCGVGELPIGPGMPTTVAAGGYTVLGPLYLAPHSAAASNSAQAATGDSELPGGTNAHVRSPGPAPQFTLLVGATIQASDGTIVEADTAPLLVDVAVAPPLGRQGGALSLGDGNNLVTYLAGVL